MIEAYVTVAEKARSEERVGCFQERIALVVAHKSPFTLNLDRVMPATARLVSRVLRIQI